MKRHVLAVALTALFAAPATYAATRSLVMLDQTNNPVSDIQLGDYEFAFLLSNGDYIGLRRSSGALERINSPQSYSFRARYAMRSMVDSGSKTDVIDLPGFSVVGTSGVGFAGSITNGILEDFTSLGFTKGKMSPNDFNDRTYLESMVWWKDVPLPNIGSVLRVGLAGFFSNALTRFGSPNANAGGFHAVGADLGAACQSNADCFNTHAEPHFSSVQDGSYYFWPGHSADTAYAPGMVVPAFNPFQPLQYGLKKLRINVDPIQIVLKRRTVRHATNASFFFRSCLAMTDARRSYTTVSDSASEMVQRVTEIANTGYGNSGIYINCVTTGSTPARSITGPSRGGAFETTRKATRRQPTDEYFFCDGDLDDLRCGILYDAKFYQASTDLRSLSYLWRGEFYLVDTLSTVPRSKITIPAGVTPVKFFGYVGNL